MVVLRCTRKLLTRLPSALVTKSAPGLVMAETTAGSTTRLGDWYANLMVVAQRPLVLCVAERSLFAIVVPLAEARTLVPRWRQAIERRLLALGIASAQVADDLAAMAEVRIVPASYGAGARARSEASAAGVSGPVRSPSVGRRMVGVLTDMAWQCEARTIRVDGAEQPDIAAMEAGLDELLCTPLDYRRPADVTRAVFVEEHSVEPGGELRLVR
jgi:hypothetical protein